MEDFERNWENHETPPVRQFDLILADILDLLVKTANGKMSIVEPTQYVRGLRDGNRFARKKPAIKEVAQ